MVSHVTLSVESAEGRNYWPQAVIRSNRFRLFGGPIGQVPKRKGQAAVVFSMEMLGE